MTMRKRLSLFLAIVLATSCLLMTGCCLKHDFAPATCTAPATCRKCGKTEGEALGHKFTAATCTTPETCSVCGATQGSALGHKFTEATCTEAAVCTVCGEVNGEALGHSGVWEETGTDILTATRTLTEKCSVCGEILDEKTEAITSFIREDNSFLFNGEEFTARLQTAWNEQIPDLQLTFKYSVSSDGYIGFDFYNRNNSWLGWGLFYDSNGLAIKGTETDAPVCSLRVIVGPVDGLELETLYYLFQEMAGPVISAADPILSRGSIYADPVAQNTYAYPDGQVLNGLFYTCMLDDEEGAFKLDVDIAK